MNYAQAAAAGTEPALTPQQLRIRQLAQPPPTSYTLTAALQLLEPDAPVVYLLTVEYVQNWLTWALHQKSSETVRAREAIRLAALQLGLVPPVEEMEYLDPGPIDSSPLSLQGHPLLLNPLADVKKVKTVAKELPTRALSLSKVVDEEPNTPTTTLNVTPKAVQCVAVPEGFYEILRSVHGVLCEDMETISFQPYDNERLLLHHQRFHQTEHCPPKPIEFRRKRVLVPETYSVGDSLMDRLLQEEQPKMVLATEVHPVKCKYALIEDVHDSMEPVGFGLMSVSSVATHVLHALMRVAVPHKASESIRVWSVRKYGNDQPTRVYDQYELVDFDTLNEGKDTHTSVAEFLVSHQGQTTELLFETRKSVNAPWPRQGKVLEERICVGDFVDAQDVAGHWYEAVVRQVEEDTVTVHYIGWNSRWDAKLKRRRNTGKVAGSNPKLQAPAPLWSRVSRWRENIKVGDIVEVRDSSSLATRPKWYKGEIKKISKRGEVHELVGGADLEKYPVDGEPDKKEVLLIMRRNIQVLVEIPQEKTEKAGAMAKSPGEGDLAAGLNPQPPFLRWVNLYGEEICAFGTHLKEKKGPATLTYDYDKTRKPVEVLKSHPSLGSGFMRESLRGVPPAPGSVGLHNLGNSCYMNSTIQCLNHIEPLTQYFLTDRYAKDLNRKNPLGSGGNVAVAYASLLKKMWGGEYSTLVPRLLKQTVAAFAPQFDNSYQHDSQEFLGFLMDGIHEDLNRVENKPYVEELEGFGMDDHLAAMESWRKHLLRHDSIIVDHCQGMHRSHLTCPRCGRESIKFDIFSSISLPLATDKKRSKIKLDDCLEKFMEGEQLDERNAWYCPNCRQHVCALKMIALWSVPDILILHLKRFTFDTCMTSGNMLRSKIDDTVEFPIEGLDLTKHVLGPIDPDAPPVYRLFGVSEHSGPTANSGHYTATVRNSIDNQWYRCNDSHVGRTSGEASITGGAYVLFYQRVKGSSRWAGMAKEMKNRSIDPHRGLERDIEGFTKVKAKKKKAVEQK